MDGSRGFLVTINPGDIPSWNSMSLVTQSNRLNFSENVEQSGGKLECLGLLIMK